MSIASFVRLLSSPQSLAASARRRLLRSPSPQGEPILTVSGKIANTNDGAVARFDRADAGSARHRQAAAR